MELEEVGPRFQLRRECPLLSPTALKGSPNVPKHPSKPRVSPPSLPDPPGDPGAGGCSRRGVALAPVHVHGCQAPPAQRHLSPPAPPEPPRTLPSTWRRPQWDPPADLRPPRQLRPLRTPPRHVWVLQSVFICYNKLFFSILGSVRIGQVLLQPLLCWGGSGVRAPPHTWDHSAGGSRGPLGFPMRELNPGGGAGGQSGGGAGQ